MTRSNSTEFIALVPAGGTGSRVGGDKPKQYLPILGEPMIVRTISALLACDWIRHVYVVVAAHDPHQGGLSSVTGNRCTILPVGGVSRRDSVLAGLEAISGNPLASGSGGSPWVMVHDAARPGISQELLERLRDCVLAQIGTERHPETQQALYGALLALPVADTIKREWRQAGGDYAGVGQTVDRTGLWAAQTPQVFPLDTLRRALIEHQSATDEASAIERQGRSPALVTGHWHNMKVTTEDDLALIGQVFQARGQASLPQTPKEK